MPPKKIKRGVEKLITTTWLRGDKVYAKNINIIVKDPKKLRKKSKPILVVFIVKVPLENKNGNNKIILKRFL